jgi:hypothetical protein
MILFPELPFASERLRPKLAICKQISVQRDPIAICSSAIRQPRSAAENAGSEIYETPTVVSIEEGREHVRLAAGGIT